MGGKFYDGNKIINMLDIEKQKPIIYMISGNRSAGKTFWCKHFMLKNFKKTGEKFIVLVRFGYQLPGMAATFFKDIHDVHYQSDEMTERCVVQNSIYELFLNGISCGYTVAMNNADSIKRNSTLFVDATTIFLDEFQSETDKYCPKEIEKFQSIYISVARGGGEQSRYVRCLLCSNTVSLLNPYFYSMNISHRIQKDTKFLRGVGFVLEITYNESAAEGIKSGIGRVLKGAHTDYAAENIYLNDSEVFIDKPSGKSTLQFVLKYEGKFYGVWHYGSFVYVSNKYDPNFKTRYSLDSDSHDTDTMLLMKNSLAGQYLKEMFVNGYLRFQDLKCKEVIFNFLGYIKG